MSILGNNKVDFAHIGKWTAISTQATRFYDMSKYDRAAIVVSAGTMGAVGATGCTLGVTIQQAVSATGSGAVTIGTSFTMGTTNLDAIADATEIAITVGSSPRSGETVVINGITFTFSTLIAGTVAMDSSRLISATSGTTDIAVQLSSGINSGTYGCTGLLATVSGSVVTVTANPPGEREIDCTISVTDPTSAGSARAIINKIVGIAEIRGEDLSVSSSMRYVGVSMQNNTSADVNVIVLRSNGRYSPVQYAQYHDEAV